MMQQQVTSSIFWTANTKIQRILSSKIKFSFCKIFVSVRTGRPRPVFVFSRLNYRRKYQKWVLERVSLCGFCFLPTAGYSWSKGKYLLLISYSVFVCVSKKSKRTFPNQHLWGSNWHQATGKSKRNHEKPSIKSPILNYIFNWITF
jgi:hypothetical protein